MVIGSDPLASNSTVTDLSVKLEERKERDEENRKNELARKQQHHNAFHTQTDYRMGKKETNSMTASDHEIPLLGSATVLHPRPNYFGCSSFYPCCAS